MVYSYKLTCIQCPNSESQRNWVKFIAVAFIPLTLLYVFAVLLNFNVNSPSLHGFVLAAQLLSSPANARVVISVWRYSLIVDYMVNVSVSLYAIWSLDFFRSLYPDMCVNVTTLQALSLEYIVAVYPLFLIMVTCVASKLHSRGCKVVIWVWKPFQMCLLKVKKEWDVKMSMIDVFATFLVLSYQKILSTNFDLLAFTSPKNSTGKSVGVYLYYDASYEYFGSKHLPYGILALTMFTCFNLIPLLLLLFYPMMWFQRYLNYFKLSPVELHTFIDLYAGCFKDGTEPGTRDYRYFAALFLCLRIVLYLIYELTLCAYFYGLSLLIIAVYTVAIIVTKPYKSIYNKYNTITAMMFMIIIMILSAILCIDLAAIKKLHHFVTFSIVTLAVMISLPQLYIIGLSLKCIYNQNLFKRMHRHDVEMQSSNSDADMHLLGAHSIRVQCAKQYQTFK